MKVTSPRGRTLAVLTTVTAWPPSPERLIDLAHQAAVAIIELKLAGAVVVRLKMPPDGRISFQPTSLRAALYLELASQIIDSKLKWRVCAGCPRAFIPRDRRQKYHDGACKVRNHRQRKHDQRSEEAK